MLTIDVLGPLVVRCDGGAVHKLPRKATALVVFLMVSGQPVPRARLADLLWPYQGSEQGRHSLRNCLLEVRKNVCRTIRSDFVNCSIGENVTSDIHRFISLARSAERADLVAACDLYRGEFLDGFHVSSEPWQEWTDSTREELKGVATKALFRLSQLLSSEGRHGEAVDAARRLVHIDPLIERFHRQLMRVLVAGGRSSEAVQQYKKLETMLRVELAVRPDINSQQLWRGIVAAGREPQPIEPEPIEHPLRRPALIDRPALAATAPKGSDDHLTELLHRLGTALANWAPGKGGLTLGMIKQAGDAMLAAAADRRRDAEDRVTKPDFEYATRIPAPPCERVAA